MRKYVLLVILLTGVSAIAFSQHAPLAARAAEENLSFPSAFEERFAKPKQTHDARILQNARKEFGIKPAGAVRKSSEYVFLPALVVVNDSLRTTYIYYDNGNIGIRQNEVFVNGVWNLASREVTAYDTHDRVDSVMQQTWVSGEWRSSRIMKRTYDAFGMLESQIVRIKTEAGFVNLSQYLFTYNSNGKMETLIRQDWGGEQWMNLDKTTYTYTASGEDLTGLYEEWNGSKWLGSWRYTYTYDDGGTLLSELYESYADSFWAVDSRVTYIYDQTGSGYTYLEEVFHNGTWVSRSRSIVTFEASTFTITVHAQVWDNDQWVNYTRYTTVLTENGATRSSLEETWIDNDWGNKIKTTNTYDDNGHLVNELIEKYFTAWENVMQKTYEYDSDGNAFRGRSYDWKNGAWVNAAGPINMHYNYNRDIVPQYGREVFVQYTALTGTENAPQHPESFSLEQNYPNPFNPATTIRYTLSASSLVQLVVYDVLGNKVKELLNETQGAGSHSVSFQAGSLASGVYIYQLRAGDKLLTKKMTLIK